VAKKVATIDDPNANYFTSASDVQRQPVDPVVIPHYPPTQHSSDHDFANVTIDSNMEPQSFKALDDHPYEIVHADDASKVKLSMMILIKLLCFLIFDFVVFLCVCCFSVYFSCF
jgi:hypothetical protein